MLVKVLVGLEEMEGPMKNWIAFARQDAWTGDLSIEKIEQL